MSTKRTWKEYLVGSVVSKYKMGGTVNRIDTSIIGFTDFFSGMATAYVDDDLRDHYLKKDSNISFIRAVSPAKLLNPFLLMTQITGFAQLGIAKLVDTVIPGEEMEASPVAQTIKSVLTYPFRLLSSVISPLANIQRMPWLAKADAAINTKLYGHEMSPLAESFRKKSSNREIGIVLGVPSLSEVTQEKVEKKPSQVRKIISGALGLFKKKNKDIEMDDLSYRTLPEPENNGMKNN